MQSYKLKNNRKIDSTGIVHNRKLLKDLLDGNMFNMPATRINSDTNVNELYKEYGIKIYNILSSKPIGLPKNVWAYGMLIVITNNVNTIDVWTNIQIYITADLDDTTNSNKGIFFRDGIGNWFKLSGTSIQASTS